MKTDFLRKYGDRLTLEERAALIAGSWSRDKALALELLAGAPAQDDFISRIVVFERKNGKWVSRTEDVKFFPGEPKNEPPDLSPRQQAQKIAEAWKKGREAEALGFLSPAKNILTVCIPIQPVKNELGEWVVMGPDGNDQPLTD